MLVIPTELVLRARPLQLRLIGLDVIYPHRVAGGAEQPSCRSKQLVLQEPITDQGRMCEE